MCEHAFSKLGVYNGDADGLLEKVKKHVPDTIVEMQGVKP